MASEKRLIDANALGIGKAKREVFDNPAYADGWNSAIAIIENAPTVDAVEVVHGRWVYNTDDFTPAYRCSACSYNKPMIAGDRVSQGAMNYCPNCGADMR